MEKEKLIKKIRGQGLLIFFALLLFLIFLFNNRFLSARNIMLVLRQSSIMGVMACGITYILISGNLDLSIGSLLSLTTILAISLHDTMGPLATIIIVLFVGVLVGMINGSLVGFFKLNSMIVTLGMLPILQAITLIYTGGGYATLRQKDTWFRYIGRGDVFNIPSPVISFIFFIIVFAIVLSKTVYGNYILAIGGNSTASRYTGIKEKILVFCTYIIVGLSTAWAGIMLASRGMGATNYIGQGYEFTVLTAVVLGGTSLFGGAGSILGTLIGVLILGFLNNGLIMLGLPYYVQFIVQWIIIISAVWLDIASERGKLWA